MRHVELVTAAVPHGQMSSNLMLEISSEFNQKLKFEGSFKILTFMDSLLNKGNPHPAICKHTKG